MMRPAYGERHDMIYFIPFRACHVHGYDSLIQSRPMRSYDESRRNPVLVSPIAGFPLVFPGLFRTSHEHFPLHLWCISQHAGHTAGSVIS